MGVHVLSPESTHQKHLRSLPRIPKNSHYSMHPLNNAKPSRALPAVPNANLAKMDPNAKLARALPRVPKPPSENSKKSNLVHRHARILPEVPFKDMNSVGFKDSNTSSSSRTSTPRHSHRESNILQTNSSNNNVTKINNMNSKNATNNNSNVKHNTHQNNTRALPKLPKVHQKPKPEQNRIEYMQELYKKEGDLQSEEGNYEQALKSYNLALKFISDEKATIIARSRVYRKLGKPRKAMQDADLALKLDPIYYEGLLQKAELLLEQGDYEGALQHFQKGARMRPDKDDFQDGIEKAKHGMTEHLKVLTRKRKNTLSPEVNTTHKKTKEKSEKAKKNRDNTIVQNQRSNSHVSDDFHNLSYGSHESSNKESAILEEPPPIMPAPPPQPAPQMSRARIKNGRQMTPMPGRLTRQLQESLSKPQVQSVPDVPSVAPPTEEEIDEDMMRQILGRMYKDKSYLEKILNETDLHQKDSVGPSAENGLHFLYDRVLNWVRKGQAVPTQPITAIPIPRETKTSARRKAMIHGSSVESLLEEQEKENEKRAKRKKKKKPQKPQNTWYQYLENKKVEEAVERKQSKTIFLHVVEGQQIKPIEHFETKKSKHGPDTPRRTREGTLKKSNEYDSKESLNHSFTFKSYRPPSDMRSSKDTKTSPMELSDEAEEVVRTPLRKTKRLGMEREKEKLERRREAVAKFVTKETEEIEMAYADNKLDLCMDKARHVIKILENEDWPEKYVAMAFLYSYLGNSAIGKKDYDGGLKYHSLDLEIGEKHKIDDAVSRALGNLGRIYVVQKKHQEALDMFLRKTPMCASRIETAWLFHEIGNCFLALGDFEYAKDAAKKSLEAAEEAVEWSYQLQSCVLMGVAEVKLKQYHAAFNTFERALDQARLQGDEKAEDAIREALQDVNDRIVEEMRTKGPMNFPDMRSDAFLTPLSRGTTTLTDYQLQGLSRSRAQIMKMEAELGFRCRADYAKTPAAASDYSSIFIPDDDGNVSLTDTNDLNLDLERLRTESTLFGSALDLRDNIRSETFVSGKIE